MQWYYKKDGGLVPGGPFSPERIRELIIDKVITPETGLTQTLEDGKWLPAGESEFAGCFQIEKAPSKAPRGLWMAAILLNLLLGGAGLILAILVTFTAKAAAFVVIGPFHKLMTKQKYPLGQTFDAFWDDTVYVALPISLLIFFAAMSLSSGKPVIYLYPEREMEVRVQLDYDGKLDATYPAYPEGGWHVTARPDGTLIDKSDGREYSYLFWDGFYDNKFDFSKGFIVKGEDTARFLQDTLAAMGLTPREYNEFIVYWLPKMRNNAYNLIAFQGAGYTDHARLTITPKPDSLLRVFMAFKSVPYPYPIPPQTFPKFERRGFTVVEWGGSDAGEKRFIF